LRCTLLALFICETSLVGSWCCHCVSPALSCNALLSCELPDEEMVPSDQPSKGCDILAINPSLYVNQLKVIANSSRQHHQSPLSGSSAPVARQTKGPLSQAF